MTGLNLALVVQCVIIGVVTATYGVDDGGLDRLLSDPGFLNTLTMRQYAADGIPEDEAIRDSLMASESLEPRDRLQTRVEDLLLGRDPAIRIRDQEYLEHSSLPGRIMMQGGAGEGQQHLKPDGSVPNVQVVKSNSILPAYCNPPNPCPIGYTAEDDCLEDFENSAAFSRDHQSKQECMCDQEHMFDCPGRSEDSEIDTLARSISNSDFSDTFESLANSIQSPGKDMDKDHKVVAKKFFMKKAEEEADGKGDMRMRYTMREKKGSSHSPLLWIDDTVAVPHDQDHLSYNNNPFSPFLE